ncbi:flavin reductase family protein [uncultured Alsobacter sp.]|uniref:flavin reductase family protein n=1 Tax=uncultured Alsobacter sp. TaxID=1748258 RepID=UPI0025EA67F7|nr:flavin reductase family protein [uncultured Alsobacter sp.]
MSSMSPESILMPAECRSALAPPHQVKHAFSRIPAGVAIVATMDADGVPQGLTASTVTPLSLEPPMLLVCMNRSVHCLPAFSQARRFAVSMLRPEHRDLASRFAKHATDKFDGVSWSRGALGQPVIDGALATFECERDEMLPGGDHIILTGLIQRAHAGEEGMAMVYLARRFHGLAVGGAD